MEHYNYPIDLATHGVVALLRNSDEEFLLLQDSRDGIMHGHWAPPHGRCELTDLDEEASVVREVKEETAIDVRPVRKILTQAADTKIKTVSFWLVEAAVTQPRVVLDTNESTAYGWFSLTESLELPLYPGTESFFRGLLRGDITLEETI